MQGKLKTKLTIYFFKTIGPSNNFFFLKQENKLNKPEKKIDNFFLKTKNSWLTIKKDVKLSYI